MTVSFTQTYGDDRKLLLDIYSRDQRLIEFKNLFDLNIYAFHNCSDEIIDHFKSINTVKNTHILKLNRINYTLCIKDLLIFLKSIKCTHFFFSQDDTFSYDNDNIDFQQLLSFVKKHENNFMYNFYYNIKDFENHIKLNILKEFNNLTIYENNSLNYRCTNRGGMDDSPYICTFDMLNTIYDNMYIIQKNIWMAEMYLFKKFYTIEIPRHIGSKTLFNNYNIIGKTLMFKDKHINKLKEKNLL